MRVFLLTDRLLLRRFTEDDVENLESLDADPEVMRLLTGGEPTPRDGGSGEEVELGYRLRRSAWGKGYATEGARALVGKAFGELGVERIYAETMAVNTPRRGGYSKRPGSGTCARFI